LWSGERKEDVGEMMSEARMTVEDVDSFIILRMAFT
jgi:hypothetical protein